MIDPALLAKDPVYEVIEGAVNLLPIVVPLAVIGVLALDGGGVVDGEWDGTGVRAKGPPREGYSGGNIQEWLDSNKGGTGNTDFTYTRAELGQSKKLLAVPELDFDELTGNPVILVAAAFFIIEVVLAKLAGVNSLPGLLGFGAGQVAKGTFDAWNAVAPAIGLGGAILKY